MKTILLNDPTLRDGSHAVSHQISAEQIAAYCKAIDKAGIDVVEVGHGNGLGASSLQLGFAKTSDYETLRIARENLKNTKLGVHVIPGFATIKKDLSVAIDLGVDVIRVASHCSEADITERHIKYAKNAGKIVYGVLMMTHMVSAQTLSDEALKMQSYGAESIVIMDSAGHYLPNDVTERISTLIKNLAIPVGFHGHNNLGMGIANSIAAIEAGASILDACVRGFGAGAGNAQLEVLVGVLEKMGYQTGVDFYHLLDAADLAENILVKELPYINSTSIVSGLAGVFSGFMKPVMRISQEFNLDARDIFFELGRRKIVAGQEDIIIEVAKDLANAQAEKIAVNQ